MEHQQIRNLLFLLSASALGCADNGGGDTEPSDDTTDGPGGTTTTGGPVTTESTSTSGTGGSDTGGTTIQDTTTGTVEDSTSTGIDVSTSTGTTTTGLTTGGSTTSTGTDSTTGGSTTSTGTSTGADTGGGVLPCAPYAYAYQNCYYPDDVATGYDYGLYYCQYYAGDCYGIDEMCDALFDEWLVCVKDLECADFELPPCPDELDDLQTTCDCGNV